MTQILAPIFKLFRRLTDCLAEPDQRTPQPVRIEPGRTTAWNASRKTPRMRVALLQCLQSQPTTRSPRSSPPATCIARNRTEGQTPTPQCFCAHRRLKSSKGHALPKRTQVLYREPLRKMALRYPGPPWVLIVILLGVARAVLWVLVWRNRSAYDSNPGRLFLDGLP